MCVHTQSPLSHSFFVCVFVCVCVCITYMCMCLYVCMCHKKSSLPLFVCIVLYVCVSDLVHGNQGGTSKFRRHFEFFLFFCSKFRRHFEFFLFKTAQERCAVLKRVCVVSTQPHTTGGFVSCKGKARHEGSCRV